MTIRLTIALLTVLFSTTYSYADLVISSETVVAAPGDTVQVDFFAADPDGVGELTGFNLPIDIGFGFDGDSIPSQLTTAPVVLTNSFGASNSYNAFPGAGFNLDGTVNIASSGAPLVLSTTPQLVFSLNFDVGTSAVPGDVFDIAIVTNPTAPFLTINGTDIGPADASTATLGAGQIVILAVPEPGTFGVAMIGLGLFASRRRRAAA